MLPKLAAALVPAGPEDCRRQ